MAIFCYKEKDDTLNAFVSGKVTRDPEVKENSKGDIVKFSVAYGKKKYMQIEAWADSDVGGIAGCLEKGDVVGVAGTYSSWEYNDKQYSKLSADMIFTLAQPAPVSVNSPATPKAKEASQYKPNHFEDLDDSEFEDDLPF